MGSIEFEDMDNPLKKRVNKILTTRLETDEDTLSALKNISGFFGDNNSQNRRNLRCQIEKRTILINTEFLQAFSNIKRNVDAVCTDLNSLFNSVESMKNNLASSKSLTHDLVKQTNTLQKEKVSLQIQQQVAEAFVRHFQLSVSEHQLLYGSNKDVPITDDFFNALDRVQNIHNDCRMLMQCGYQTVASDIMAEMTLHQEGALERLYRWTQCQCRNLENTEIDLLTMKAMHRLQDRPVLLKYVTDEYAIARRTLLVRSFIEALTEGRPGDNPRPIEMYASDPKRYIGDMFAWLHQALLSEKENLNTLLKQCDKNDLSEQIQHTVDYVADVICHPLKVRVETILKSEKDTIVLFALSNLIRFYQQIIKQVVQGGTLQQCLIDLQKASDESYLKSLTIHVRHILQKPNGLTAEPPQTDLLPPLSLGRLLNLLKEILSVATMVDGRQADILKIVACVIDPLLQAVQDSAAHLPTVDMAVYLLNCLYHMQNTLAVYEYMDERLEHLKAQSEAQIDTLVSEQASFLVNYLQFNQVYAILQNTQSKNETALLKEFTTKLDNFLEMPEVVTLPQIELIISSGYRSKIQKRSFDVIIAIYKQIYERIHDTSHGFERPENILSKTPDQIAHILRI